MYKAKVILGEHKGQTVEVTGVHWSRGIITAILEDGTKYGFKFDELEKIEKTSWHMIGNNKQKPYFMVERR